MQCFGLSIVWFLVPTYQPVPFGLKIANCRIIEPFKSMKVRTAFSIHNCFIKFLYTRMFAIKHYHTAPILSRIQMLLLAIHFHSFSWLVIMLHNMYCFIWVCLCYFEQFAN